MRFLRLFLCDFQLGQQGSNRSLFQSSVRLHSPRAGSMCFSCFLTVRSLLCPELIWSELSGPTATATRLIPTGPSAKTLITSRHFEFTPVMFTQSFQNTLTTGGPDWPHGSSVGGGRDRLRGEGTSACIYQPCAYATTLTVPPRLSDDLFFSPSPYSTTQFLYNLIKNVFKHFCCSGCSVAVATKFTHYYEVPEAWN